MSSRSSPYVLIFDGGADPNPGVGYGSYRITSPSGRFIHRHLSFADQEAPMTNNQAEYATLIDAMRCLLEKLGRRATFEHLRIEGDSQLVLNQTAGQWKVKTAGLRELQAEASRLVGQFSAVEFVWHPRARSLAILGH
jgi:ribonuclease HI